ncbi:proliferation marker protein Ki-67 isoform X2 [Xyrichtys novacula]|uniref:Proliferation marker protein Ki-67 isoform X2 n=1 Tax=Xyrichtys novacula TaxID=13765 RepID=A0AAV1H473_XYRNO|nr:proliferation marker protein Ki-67 isoform X2 [Xyrichtys novacula]
MPLHGKIVVIKRSGGDGTEFPLTATCLFGRKPDCDIRIQLPQVSKEHCRIDLNENKEVILTNLSSVNPTRVNGEALQQSERLKHGDVITIIDRSFRFEYPPAPTPKKRSSTGGKSETLKVLQDQQVVDLVTSEISGVSTDPHLKDGTNHDNIQRPVEKTTAVESRSDDSQLQNKTTSPFNDLYQMIKKSLDVKTPRKSSASLLQTPTSRFCTPKPVISTGEKSTPKKDEAQVPPAADEVKMEEENKTSGTPKSVKKQRRSSQTPSTAEAEPETGNAAKSETPSPQRRNRTPPQRFTAGEVVDQICSKSSPRRRSKEATPVKSAVTSPKAERILKASPKSPRTAEKVKGTSKKRKSGELPSDLPISEMKRKRVSFGGHLSPELFDKRLPPDSPLRKGAAPRRSLGLLKPKQSLLRRASVIGLLEELSEKSPAKKKTQSPKKSASPKGVSPKSAQKSPKSRSPSPKAATPAKQSPKSKSPSPKAATPAKKSPKSTSPSPKAATPAKVSPKSRSASPKAQTPRSKSPSTDKMETPKSTKQTPTVQGRFSVSRISTPSPVAEECVPDVTPKMSQKRKSIVRKTPKLTKSAVKVMARRSGISRASLKAKNLWAEIVKFGQPKTQVVAPTKRAVIRKTKKKTAVSKPQTPARALPGHVSTGHACSPVTIVVSRAQAQKLVQPSGAAPRLVTNIAVLKKNLKMDEDLSGVSEMFKTPAHERKTRSLISESSAMKTPMRDLETPLVEPSVLSTPEEPGEMMVSPLSVSSTVKNRQYNSEAVKRLLDGEEESSFVSDAPTMENHSDEQQCTDSETTSVSTPKQKLELPDCLTGVKRIMKTPKQTAEPVEDLRGRLLKTPKQKLEQQECLTGVKRIMKTPKQKAEPIEDLRGKILKTPKQKPEEQECLSGVKRILKTPKQKVEPVEDIRGNLLMTPKQKPEQLECLSGIKRIMQTPQQEAESLEDLSVKLLETPKAPEASDAGVDAVEDLAETAIQEQESEDVFEETEMKTPKVKSAPQTPKETGAPVEDMIGVERLLKTPKEKSGPVEENFGIQTLMKTPRLRETAPVEDFEGLQELMEEPLSDPAEEQETKEVEDQSCNDDGEEVAKELEVSSETQQDAPSDEIDALPTDMEKDANIKEVIAEDILEEAPKTNVDNEASDATGNVCEGQVEEMAPEEQPTVDTVDENLSEEQPTVEENLSKEQLTVDTVDENLSEEQPEVETETCNATEMETTTSDPEPQAPASESAPEVEEATCKSTEMETTAEDPVVQKKPVRGRRAKAVETKAAEEKQEPTEKTEEPIISAPVRGRRGRKNEAPAAPAVRQTTRGRKTAENTDAESAVEESEALPSEAAVAKPKRGRNAKKASNDQAEIVKVAETEIVPTPESEVSPPAEEDQDANVIAASVEKAVVKPKRGQKAKQPKQAAVEQQAAVSTPREEPQTDVVKVDEVCSERLEVVPCETEECKPSDADEAVPNEAPVSESLPEAEACKDAEKDAAVVQKKPARGRRPKMVESKVEVEQEVVEHPEEPVVVSAPVRARRGKKTEAAAPAAGRKTTRGRNTKSQESTSDDQPEVVPEQPVEASPVPEVPAETVTEDTGAKEESDSAPPAEEVAVKPTRGRRAKQTPVEQPEPQKHEVPDEQLTADAESQKSVPTVGKPRRGRKTKPDTPEQNEEAEDPAVTVETKQPAQPPVRAKRGRNIKEKEEKHKSTSAETSESQEPARKVRRTRKAEQTAEEPKEEVQPVETVSPDEVEAAVVEEPVTVKEQTAAAAKPRRGRKAKQDTEIEIPVESTEVQENLSVSTTDKPKRGRRGKPVTEEAEVPAEVPEEKPEAEEKDEAEPEAAVIKPSRGRARKLKAPQAVPAKRARRGAAAAVTQEETHTEPAAEASEPASISVEPAKRGRRAAPKPTTEDAQEASKQETPTDDSSNIAVEDKVSKRSVRWKSDVKVIEIPKATPVKAVRGRRAKPADPGDAESKSASKDESKPEEKDLSDTAVKALPLKRAKRGAKVADATPVEAESTSTGGSVEAETQPKTRKGRSAKK